MPNFSNTRWPVSPAAWLPIALAIVAESVSNALRAYALGAYLDRYTIIVAGQPVSLSGSVLVLAAIAISITQARAAWIALTPGLLRQRVIASLAAGLLLSISIVAMASHILEAQRAKVAAEGGARSQYDRAQAAYDKAHAELVALAGTRPSTVIQAAMGAAPVSRTVFERTKQCTDVTRDDSFEVCKPILDLRKEMADAIRKRDIESEVAHLRYELAALNRPEEASAPENLAVGGWAWIMGLGVVFVATFGGVIFARVEAIAPETANDIGRPAPGVLGAERLDGGENIVDWVRAFRQANARDPQIRELQAKFPGTPKTTAWRRCKMV